MKQNIFVVSVVVLAFLISTIQAGSCQYTWKNTCSNNCNLDTADNWVLTYAGWPESPIDCDGAYLDISNQLTNAFSSSNWKINRIWAPNCSKKKSIKGTTAGIVELNFSDNRVELREACVGISNFKTYLTFTNTTFIATGEPSLYVSDGGAWKFIDSTVYLNNTDFATNVGGLTYEFTNSKVYKQYVSRSEPTRCGIELKENDILKIDNTEFTLATALYIPQGVQLFLSGNTKLDAATESELTAFYWRGNTTISAPANITLHRSLYLDGYNGIPSFTKIEANTILNIVGEQNRIEIVGYGLNNIDVYGTINTPRCQFYRTVGSSGGDVLQIKLHTGGVINCNGELVSQAYLKKRGVNTSSDKRDEYGDALETLVIQGGVLNSYGEARFAEEALINVTSGTANFFGTAQSRDYCFNFLGGDTVFNGATTFYHPVTIYGGSVTIKSDASTDTNPLTVEDAGGLILAGGSLAANVTLNDGYIAGYGKITGDVIVNAKSEVRLNSVSNHLNVSGTVTIKAQAKIIITADNVGCAQANVESLDLANGVIFGVSFSGQSFPANNSECTILKYSTAFSGSVPSQPITEPTYGATLTITRDESAKEIKVQITLPAPSPPIEPVSEPTPSDTPTNTPPPTNSPNSGSKIFVGFEVVLFAFFMLLISLLN